MNSTLRAQRGFTLVEIMVVVVIIALLAGMAIPAWQRVRIRAVAVAMDADARQLAHAAQQYFMDKQVDAVEVGIAADGAVSGALQRYVSRLSVGYTGISTPMTFESSFTMGHQILGPLTVEYTPEGKRITEL